MSARLLITGGGLVAPIGCDRRAFVAALAAAERGPAPATRIGAFDESVLPEGRSLRRATAHVHYGVAAARAALDEAAAEGSPPEEDSIVFASAIGSANFSYRLWQALLAQGPAGASPVLFSEGVPNALTGHVARTLRLLGPGHMLGGGSDAGLRALALARDLLECRRARRVLVGAAEERAEIASRGYARLGVAARTTARRGATRGRGLIPSEGSAALLMERGGDLAPGRRALAELRAVESLQLARVRPGQDHAELAALIVQTLDRAGATLADVRFVARACNGTSVDELEERALARLRANGLSAVESDAVRAATGDAFTATPLWQVFEAIAALETVEARRPRDVALVLSIGQFGGATAALFGRA